MCDTEGKRALAVKLNAFSGLLVISGDRFDFIQVFYAFKIQQLCWHAYFASGYFLLQPP